jgi:V/A-type H+-transporting ATPase subunit E
MSLDKVVEDILRKGEEKKREIIRQGEQERDQVLHQAKADAEASREKADRQFQVTVSQMEQQELSSAEQELAHLPAERRKPLYDKLVAKAQKELGACYVYSTEEDRALLKLPKGMEDGGSIECTGGLVFETKDRSVRLDYRFESLMEEVWNRKMQEIYGKLFG